MLKLAATINATLGASVLQSQSTDLNLGTFATPFNDKTFLLHETSTIANLTSESARLDAISELIYWDVPAEGGFFDRLGSVGVLSGQAPHLDMGEGEADPAFYYTPHHETLAQSNWHCPPPPPATERGVLGAAHESCNADGIFSRGDWTSFTLGPSHGSHPVTLRYEGLDPEATYRLSVLFFSAEFKLFLDERNTLTAGSTTLMENAASPRPMRRRSFTVPKEETKGGSLKVQCTSAASGGGVDGKQPGGCSIIAVWLEPM